MNSRKFIMACIMTLFFSVPLARASQFTCQSYCKEDLYNKHQWSLLYYYGVTDSDGLLDIPIIKVHATPERSQTVELAYTLSEQNKVRKFFHPVIPIVQIAGNVTYRYGHNQPKIYEFDPYIVFRWVNFIWNPYVNTSFAIGEGVSYATSIPIIESYNNPKAKRFLNYLVFEATFAAPNYPRLQLLARLQHRSGVFGLYQAGRKDGTNALGLGVRYLFG